LEKPLAAQLTYRLAEDADLPGVLRLWQHETDWGTLTPELWRRWYIETPYGRSLVVVAVDELEELAGQVILTPSRLSIDEREVLGLRLSALTLRKDLRGMPLQNAMHPVSRLYLAAIEVATAAGFGLLYCLPGSGLFPFLQRAGVTEGLMTAEYGCAAAPIPAAPTRAACHLTARPVADFGPGYEALWQAAKTTFPIGCGIVRSPDRLRYNHAAGQARAAVANARYLTLEVYDPRKGLQVGYSAMTTAASDPGMALLVDILARHPAQLTEVLAATLNWLVTERGVQAMDGHVRLSAMAAPALKPALRVLGFTPVDYTFGFIWRLLDPSVPAQAVAPQRWYVMPGD
jgi:hypothetical protein